MYNDVFDLDAMFIPQQFKSAMASIRGSSYLSSTMPSAAEDADADGDITALLVSDLGKDVDVKVASLQRWYEEEQSRIKRRTEFHIEVRIVDAITISHYNIPLNLCS
jgi:hypothetical protein